MFREDQENRPVASFASRNFENRSSSYKGDADLEFDPNSFSIINEFLGSNDEWSNVSDIVLLTFQAFNKVISYHATALREIESVLPLKANKNDVHSLMSSKANVKDIRKTISDMAQDIQNKTTFDEVRQMICSAPEGAASGRGKYIFDHIFTCVYSMNTLTRRMEYI